MIEMEIALTQITVKSVNKTTRILRSARREHLFLALQVRLHTDSPFTIIYTYEINAIRSGTS
jgi:hypothetical protein